MSTGIIAIAAALAIAISTIGPGIGQGLAAAHAMDAKYFPVYPRYPPGL